MYNSSKPAFLTVLCKINDNLSRIADSLAEPDWKTSDGKTRKGNTIGESLAATLAFQIEMEDHLKTIAKNVAIDFNNDSLN